MEERNNVLGEAYKEHYDGLYRKAYGRLKNEMDAEDAVQEAFALALKYFSTYNPEKSKPVTWVARILINVCNSIQQQERMKGMSMEFDEELHEGYEMTHLGDQLKERMRAHIMRHKNDNARSVLMMYYIKAALPKEIHEVTGVKMSAIEWILSRFKSDMKRRYGDE